MNITRSFPFDSWRKRSGSDCVSYLLILRTDHKPGEKQRNKAREKGRSSLVLLYLTDPYGWTWDRSGIRQSTAQPSATPSDFHLHNWIQRLGYLYRAWRTFFAFGSPTKSSCGTETRLVQAGTHWRAPGSSPSFYNYFCTCRELNISLFSVKFHKNSSFLPIVP